MQPDQIISCVKSSFTLYGAYWHSYQSTFYVFPAEKGIQLDMIRHPKEYRSKQ